jgi:hypothetical protein
MIDFDELKSFQFVETKGVKAIHIKHLQRYT